MVILFSLDPPPPPTSPPTILFHFIIAWWYFKTLYAHEEMSASEIYLCIKDNDPAME
jgi:hypothetical protein